MPGRGRGRGRAPPTGGRLFLMRSAEECGYDVRNLRSLQDITKPELFPPMLLHSSGDNRRLGGATDHEDLTTTATPASSLESQPLPQSQPEKGVKVENNEHGPLASGQPSNSKKNGTKRSSQTLYLITKGREIHHRIQDSAFYVRTTKEVPDIIRYSDASKPPPITDASTVLSHCLRGKKRTLMGYFIPEELVSGQKVAGSSGGTHKNSTAGDMDATNNVTRPRLGSMDNAEGGTGAGVADDEEFPDGGSEDELEDYVADYYASEDEDQDGDNEATF